MNLTTPRLPYPQLEPYRQGRLRVSALHQLHVEESGNPDGLPVVCLHGGPGAGSDPGERRLFDPTRYRIVQLDQRGCGRSTPLGSVDENTTWDLVEDLEKLRVALGLAAWLVFGGSWGSALALAYAQLHPTRVTGLVLRGIFLLRPRELAWYYQSGASRLAPDHWEAFVAPIPEAERSDLLRAYHARLLGAEADAAARAWAAWELSTCTLAVDEALVARATSMHADDRAFCLALARIETHYFVHGAWLDDRPLLAHVDVIRHLPCTIVQGRYDLVCPPESAWALQRAWPEATFRLVESSGHSAYEPAVETALLEATDAFAAQYGSFKLAGTGDFTAARNSAQLVSSAALGSVEGARQK